MATGQSVIVMLALCLAMVGCLAMVFSVDGASEGDNRARGQYYRGVVAFVFGIVVAIVGAL